MKKYLGLMIFIAIIFILSGCMINSYPDKVVYFDSGRNIYSYNLKTKEKLIVAKGFSMQISHKKDRLIYSNIEMQQNGALTASSGIYIYDMNTKKSFSIFPLKHDDDPIGILNWSPDDRYIVLEGSEIDNGFLILDSTTGNKIASSGIHETDFSWLNTNEIIFSERQDNVHQDKHSSGVPYGITIMNVVNNQKHVLKEASDTVSYYFQELTPENNIIFMSISFIEITNNKGRLEYPTTYWLMDDKGTILKEMPNYQPTWQQYKDNLPDNIKSQLSKPYDKYADMYIRPLSGNWVILIGSNRNPGWEFFIMDKTNPKSLLKFGEGDSIDW